MPTQIYKTKDGKRVPGTTTIISRFKDSGGLIHWAWQEGVEGRDYRETRDKAAGIGTIAHSLVEAHIRGREVDLSPYQPDDVKRAQTAFSAFLRWAEDTNLTAVETEVPLVSEKYRYGGTLDAMLVRGALCLGDWKTSNSVYQDYLIQLAAYGNLWEENFPDRPIEGGYHLIRFDRENGDFAHYWYPELSDAWEQFKLFRQAYELDKILKKRVR